MLTIRLFRVGKKNQPAFKIVVTEKQHAASRGRFIEEVGFYNPLTKQRNLKGDRVKYWMSVGAKPSETVHNMLVTDKVLEAKKVPKNKKSKKEAPAETPAQAAQPAAEASEPAVEAETPAATEPEKPADAPAQAPTEEKPAPEPKAQPETNKAEEKPEEEKKEEKQT